MSKRAAYLLCYGLPLPVLVVSLLLGPTDQVNPWEYVRLCWQAWMGAGLDDDGQQRLELAANILFNIRLPRVLLTFMSGAALATSGAVLQGVFRNPLVDSYVLGISSGAAFGAALAITYALLPLNVAALVGGTVAVVLTYSVAVSSRQVSIVAIVLSGMVISGIFTALMAIVQYTSNPYKLQAVVQWTMGYLHTASWQEVRQSWLPIVLSLAVVFVFRWRINLVSLGDDAAKAVGVHPAVDKLILVGCATLMTAMTVASAGIISFYGLFVPHIVRMAVGADNVRGIPANIFMGGTLLLVIDDFSRSLFSFEVPVGIFTMVIGGIFFVYLMRRNRLNWN